MMHLRLVAGDEVDGKFDSSNIWIIAVASGVLILILVLLLYRYGLRTSTKVPKEKNRETV